MIGVLVYGRRRGKFHSGLLLPLRASPWIRLWLYRSAALLRLISIRLRWRSNFPGGLLLPLRVPALNCLWLRRSAALLRLVPTRLLWRSKFPKGLLLRRLSSQLIHLLPRWGAPRLRG